MKKTAAYVVAVFLGVGVGYWLATKPQTITASSQITDVKPQIVPLQRSPESASNQVEASSALNPKEILIRLASIDPAAPELRARKIRQIIHQLESLVDAGTNAFVPIRHFIATDYDVSYLIEDPRQGAAGSFWNWRPGTELRSGLVLPPTLRIGVIDVIRYIGGEGAETSLAWMVANTRRPFEVPYLAQALETIAPGRYNELALQAAKRTLWGQSTNATSDRIGALGVGYIYNWLNSCGDTSMVAFASERISAASGVFDLEAARYLFAANRPEALELLARTYENSTDADTRNKIATLTMEAVGSSVPADNVFKDWILNSAADSGQGVINARPKELAIRMLAGGNFGPFHTAVPTDPSVIAARLQLLNELKPRLTTERLRQAVDQTIQSLSGQLGSR